MRKVILYIATSLDGYIAKEDGSVDWLTEESPDISENAGYSAFLERVDTILMGYRTYRQIAAELSPGKWPYEGKDVCVLTHSPEPDRKGIRFVNEKIDSLLGELTASDGKDIWICGGADVVKQCMEHRCIDIYHITVIPRLLGKGIPLFDGSGREEILKLISSKSYSGMVEMIYSR